MTQALRASGIERIAQAFDHARGENRAALMPYLMGGFPDLDTSLALGRAYADGGADLVELGVPFSDPLADGPVIHAAATDALAAGATFTGVLDVAGALSGHFPVVLMCYANMVIARGEQLVAQLEGAGVAGVIVPDLPMDTQTTSSSGTGTQPPATAGRGTQSPAAAGTGEALRLMEQLDAAGIALVPLVAPTTPDDRLAQVGALARGFLYTVSVTGTTGERGDRGAEMGAVIARAAACTNVPVAIGFGISTGPQAAAAAAAGADGVIVGSRLVRAAREADDPAAAVREVVSELADALRQ